MAKKRKKGKPEPEDYEFRPPDFDEKEFLQKELRDTRAALLTIVYAICFGLVAGLISMMGANLAPVAFLVGIAGIFTLKYFYAIVKVDTSGLKKRNWAGSIGTYFFTFLAIWVLTLNVPFSDHAPPSVNSVIVWVDNGTNVSGKEYKLVTDSNPKTYQWTALDASNDLVIHATSNYRINITAKVTDNGQLRTPEIAVDSVESGYHAMTYVGNLRWEYNVTGDTLSASDNLMFFISARDAAGNPVLFIPASTLPVEP
ncbi:MAG: DUF5379 domain-containing protein [Candidatus Thermoplasmatota archaeon]|nr:DUF5379 domain-containing protein [Candidatus Thermoplasmatota archaeon]